MDTGSLIDALERFGKMLPAVVADVSDTDARWRPADDGWSILEIVCHLGDEEQSDFPARLRSTLDDPTRPWPAIDPVGWASQRDYNQRQLADEVGRFAERRAESVAWLRSLPDTDWDQTHQHPSIGPMSAGDLLSAWSAHDYLHLRQIAKRMYQMVLRDAQPYRVEYAGEWKA